MGRVNVTVLIFQGLREWRHSTKVTPLVSVGARTGILIFLGYRVMPEKSTLSSLIMSCSTTWELGQSPGSDFLVNTRKIPFLQVFKCMWELLFILLGQNSMTLNQYLPGGWALGERYTALGKWNRRSYIIKEFWLWLSQGRCPITPQCSLSGNTGCLAGQLRCAEVWT